MIMVFDIESNGMILNYSSPPEDFNAYPRISQLSYQIFDLNFNKVKEFNQYVLPIGWTFLDEPFFRENADINKNFELGKPIKEVLNELISDRLKCTHMVAHNITFDAKVIRSEMVRNGFTQEFTGKKICTMNKSKKFCNLPPTEKMKAAGMNFPKSPTLTELHNILFKCNFDAAHDSMGDVSACAKCFFELVKLKIIEIN